MVIGEQALDEYIIISDTGSRNEKISLMCLFTFIYFSRYSLLSFARSFSVSTALVGGLTLLLFAVSLILYTAGGLDHISFDGKHWYLSVGYEVKQEEVELTDESLGIDLGVKELAVVSNQDASKTKFYKNINKSAKVRKLEKKLRRAQRKASRKLEANTKSHDKNRRPIWKRPLRECRNIQRQNKEIHLLHKKLTDIRNNHLHQATAEIVKTKPSQIVMEDLNVKGMMKNKHLAEAIAKQKFYEFKRQIQYKAEMYGIKVVEVDRFYASSKTCSNCGHIKKDLKLSDRTYICPVCGAKLDRDLNAAINLANYKTA